MWTFGGRVNESCDPPLGPVEYAPMLCDSLCTGLTDVAIGGPEQLLVGETGIYSATILPIDATAPVTLLWDNGGTTPEITYTWDLPGEYTVVITATNCEGASVVTDTFTVSVSDVPISGLSAVNDSPTALGMTTTLTATLESGTNVVYTWDLGDGTVAEGAVVSHVYPAADVYTAVVTATNAQGWQTAATVVTVEETIDGLSAANDSPTALGLTTTLTATLESGTDVVYTWDLGDGTFAEGAVVSHVYPAADVYTAVVTAANSLGWQSAATVVTVEEPISGLAAANDSPTTLGLTTTLTATLESGTDVVYTWDLGDGSFAEGSLVGHVYAEAGVYTAVVTATNAVGWQTAATIVVVEGLEENFFYFLPMVVQKQPLAALVEPY